MYCTHFNTRTLTVYRVFIFHFNSLYYIFIQIILLFATYFPLYCCVTCESLTTGINKGTSYLKAVVVAAGRIQSANVVIMSLPLMKKA